MTRMGVPILGAFAACGIDDSPLPDYDAPGATAESVPFQPPAFACSATTQIAEVQRDLYAGSRFTGYDPAEPTRAAYIALDRNGNGIPEEIVQIRYDAAGRLVTYRVDGDDARIETFTYAGSGDLPSRIDTDWDGDGRLDWYNTFEYDADGRPLQVVNHTASGTVWRRERYAYEHGGLVLYTLDYNDDGDIEERHTNTVDDLGRPLTETIDLEDDGVIDSVTTYLWTHATLEIGELRFDHDGDGVVDASAWVERNAAGQDLARLDDTDDDGRIDETFLATYDHGGRIVWSSREYYYGDYDGHRLDYLDERTWTYDALGRTVSDLRVIYQNGNLITDIREESTFEGDCP